MAFLNAINACLKYALDYDCCRFKIQDVYEAYKVEFNNSGKKYDLDLLRKAAKLFTINDDNVHIEFKV